MVLKYDLKMKEGRKEGRKEKQNIKEKVDKITIKKQNDLRT